MSHRSARLGMGINEQTFRLCTLEASHSVADRKGAHKYVLEKFRNLHERSLLLVGCDYSQGKCLVFLFEINSICFFCTHINSRLQVGLFVFLRWKITGCCILWYLHGDIYFHFEELCFSTVYTLRKKGKEKQWLSCYVSEEETHWQLTPITPLWLWRDLSEPHTSLLS